MHGTLKVVLQNTQKTSCLCKGFVNYDETEQRVM